MDCFIFEAAGKYLGIEARYIYRVADDVKPTPVPLVPSFHAGIIYYRGDIFDVIDLCHLLGNESPPSPDKTPYVILVKWDQRKLGLIPDQIVGIKWIEDTDNTQTLFTRDGRAIQIITPDEIWRRLSNLPYGY
jgi:chemotaxis signal transduction protein